MPDTLFFFNNFTDLNYLAPLVLDAGSRGERLHLVFLGTDLKRATKIFFKQRLGEILGWDFIQEHDITEIRNEKQLRAFWREHSSTVVASTPTLQQLIEQQYVGDEHNLIGLGYFGESRHETIDRLSLLFLSSPIWGRGLPAEKIKYGIPYWDLFATRDWLKRVPEEDFEIVAGQKTVIVPEIMQDGDSWFEEAAAYVTTHYEADAQYYLKYRLKTKKELKRNKRLEKSLKQFPNITPVYSPYFFTTVRLLQGAEVVLTSNASLFIADCMAAGATVIKAFDQPRSVWPEPESNQAVENYLASPADTKEQFFSNLGQSTALFWSESATLFAETSVAA